jgi:pimeloyl-ACP methyl ester carboxylesterase
MKIPESRPVLAVAVVVLLVGGGLAVRQLPAAGAGGLLHPARRRIVQPPPETCRDAVFAGARVSLKGWLCRASGQRRGTLVFLHGIADNRTSAVGVIQRFGPRGFDVVAYDSRAHGESEGDACTYGFLEKQDLHGVLDTIDGGAIVF